MRGRLQSMISNLARHALCFVLIASVNISIHILLRKSIQELATEASFLRGIGGGCFTTPWVLRRPCVCCRTGRARHVGVKVLVVCSYGRWRGRKLGSVGGGGVAKRGPVEEGNCCVGDCVWSARTRYRIFLPRHPRSEQTRGTDPQSYQEPCLLASSLAAMSFSNLSL